MNINSKRLLENLQKLQRFTDTPGEGVTRFSYGTQDARVRQYIIDRAEAIGARVEMDDIGNMRIGLGTNVPGRPAILCGSHVDTVRNGGWLDGIYGVCSALEILESLAEADSQAPGGDTWNYEMIIFAEEEGSNFGSTMTGSKFITGKYKDVDRDLLKDDEDRSLRQRLADLPEEYPKSTGLTVPWELSKAAVMLELHIEQGPVLDRAGIGIGIVDNIFGMRVIEVTLKGVGNHAGATPMKERYDALCAASECILAAERIVKNDPEERTVATVGKLDVQPNCSNVIPETVQFTVEVRDSDEDEINGNMERIISEIRRIAERRGVECTVHGVSRSQPLQLDEQLIDLMKDIAGEKGLACQIMDSGAVHDACMMAEAGVPTGMLFVPSIDGRSHVPEENTNEADLITGCQLLLDVVCRLRG